MDRWTNIVNSLWKGDYARKHKIVPNKMTNVAAGTLKRLKDSLREKKRSRCTEFDSVRNLSKSDSSIQLTEAEKKSLKRKEQLIKWRQERQQKKQIAAKQKKKPFVVGVIHQPLYFVPPPPVPQYVPSTSGRITRSQTARNETIKQKESKQSNFKSFAPKNAVFQPPKLNISYPILQLDINRDKNTKKMDIQKAVENFAKNTTNVKALMTRSQTMKPIQNVKIVKPVAKPRNINLNQKETTSNISDMSKTNSSDKTNSNLRNKRNILNKNNKLTKKNVNKTTNKINGVPKDDESNLKTKTIEFKIEEKNKLSLKRVQNKPRRVQTPRRPLTKRQRNSDEKSDVSFSSQENTAFGTCDSSQEQDNNINITPKNVIPKSESSSEEKLKKQCLNDSVMTPEQIRKEAEHISPRVILSRGKDNARRELKQKLEEGLIDEMGSTESVHHFRQQLHSEIVRMTKMCEAWDQIFENKNLPESVQEQILSATGQARLLMSQKFQQFSGLVDKCAAGEACVGGGLVTPTDLQGFWDMLFIQVDNINLRFIELEKLKQRGWTEDEKPKQLEKKSTNNVKKQSKPAATSRLREMIAASRKALKEQSNSPTSNSEDQKAYQTSNSEDQKAYRTSNSDDQKAYRVSLPFCPSPLARCSDSVLVKGSTPHTPSSAGRLLCSSQVQKSARRSLASYAMLRASQISKNVVIEGVSPLEQTPKNLTPINLHATPARSILKSNNTDISTRKLTKTVLFDNYGSDSDTRNNSSIFDDEKVHTNDSKSTFNQTDENIESSHSKVPLKENTECTSINSNMVENAGKHKETMAKKNKKKTLLRQQAFNEEAVDSNRIMTRQRRQSAMMTTNSENGPPQAETETKTLRSSKKKKALQEVEINIHQSKDMEKDDDTLIRGKSTRRQQKISELYNENMVKSTPRKSNRKSKASTATGVNFDEFENIPYITPRKSLRKRDSKIAV